MSTKLKTVRIFCLIFAFYLMRAFCTNNQQLSKKKTVCIVVTTESQLMSRGVAVWNTWGQAFIERGEMVYACYCKNVLTLRELVKNNSAIPDQLKPFLAAVDYPILHVDVKEHYRENGIKCMVVLKEAFKLYAGAEWWYVVDDDAYVFVDNLFKFISQLNMSEPLLYGFHFTYYKPGGFPLGGSGIIFTNESMTRLVKKINQDDCKEHRRGHGDIMIGLYTYYLGIRVNNFIGKQRFHGENPYAHTSTDRCPISTKKLALIPANWAKGAAAWRP